jgi:hypothetical protein
MKLLLAAVLFAGCAKANDVGRLEDEAIATAQEYAPTVKELGARASELFKEHLGPDATSRLRDAKAEIARMNGEIQTTTRAQIEKDTGGDADRVQQKIDNVESDLQRGILVATDHLEAVESWLAVAERTPVAATPPIPATP